MIDIILSRWLEIDGFSEDVLFLNKWYNEANGLPNLISKFKCVGLTIRGTVYLRRSELVR